MCDNYGSFFQVLDELLSILWKLQSSDQPPRSHEFLQELRDISSMAMEHFDEKIAPGLKSKLHVHVPVAYPFKDVCRYPTKNESLSTIHVFIFWSCIKV